MALKKKLTKTEYDAAKADIKTEYKLVEGKTDEYELDIEGGEDTGALLRAKDHEKRARQEAETKLREAQEKLDKIEADAIKEREKAARESGDTKALEKSWKEKLEKREAELAKQIEVRDAALANLTVDNVAQQIAAKISTAPSILIPHIKNRLRSEIVDGVATTKVVDAKGLPSALTVAELEAEFVANKDYAAIITGSKASGGGARGSQDGGGAPAQGGKVDFSKGPKAVAASLAASGKLHERPGV